MLRVSVIAFLSVALLAPAQDKPKEAQDPAPETHTVAKGDLTPVFELEATYEALETADYKVRMEAYQGELTIVKVAAHGHPVKRGEPILALDRAPIEKQIAAVENDLRVARATLEKAQADLQLGARSDPLAMGQAQNGVRDAETNLKAFDEVDGKQLIQQAEIQVKFNEDNLADQQEELEQLLKMYKSEELTNATSEIVVRRTRRQLERSKLFLEMAREDARIVKTVRHPQQRQALVNGLENAKTSLESLKVAQALGKVQREAEAVRAAAGAAQQEEQLARLKRDLEQFSWRAPFDGRVFYGPFQGGAWPMVEQMTMMLHPGERLQPGQVLLTLAGTRTRLRADLAEADYFDVAPGQAASVAPVSQPEQKSDGTVAAKSVTAAMKGPGGAFDVRIELKEAPGDYFPGMKAKATIKGKELKGVMLIPSTAASAGGPKITVNVSKNGKTSSREITVGKSDGKMTHVRSGLEAGEKVVLQK